MERIFFSCSFFVSFDVVFILAGVNYVFVLTSAHITAIPAGHIFQLTYISQHSFGN